MADTGRRASVSTRDSSEQGHTVPSSLSQPHRRMSRIGVDPAQLSHLRATDRRMSTFRRPSLAGSQRTDLSHHSYKPQVKLANTYRTEPKENEVFRSSKVREVVQSVMSSYLEGEDYEPHKCAAQAQSLSDVIKKRIRDMSSPRYKIVCNVIIGQKDSQGVNCVSRCIWNTKTDSSASAVFENRSIYAVATIYGMYHE